MNDDLEQSLQGTVAEYGAEAQDTPAPPATPEDQLQQTISSQQAEPTEQQVKLRKVTEEYSKKAEEYWGPESPTYWLERAPFVGTGHKLEMALRTNTALKAFESGEASDEQIQHIGQTIARRQYESEKSIGQNVGDIVSQAPGLAMEFAAGGAIAGPARAGATRALGMLGEGAASSLVGRTAVGLTGLAAQTAATPSMWVERAVQNNEEAGRDPLSPKGLATGLALGMAQTAVMGKVAPYLGKFLPAGMSDNIVGRVGTQFITGPFTQAATDVITSAAHLDTGYGAVGKLFHRDEQGRWSPDVKGAFRDSFLAAVTFATFEAVHRPEERQEVMDAYGRAMRELAGRGISRDKAGEAMLFPSRMLQDMFAKDPQAGREQGLRMMKDLPDGPIKDWGLAQANVIPDKTPQADLDLFKNLGIEAPANPPANLAGPPDREAAPGRPPEAPPASPAPEAANEPPKFENARQEADWLEKKHLDALGEIRDAQLNERAVKQMVDMGFPKQKEYQAAVERRQEANKALRRLQKRMDEVRVKAAAEEPPGAAMSAPEAEQFEAQGPRPGIDELPAATPEGLIAKMRVRQGQPNQVEPTTQYAGQEGVTSPRPIVTPPPPRPIDTIKGMPLINEGVYDLGKLAPHERRLLDMMFGDDKSLGDLAKDPTFPTVNTKESVKRMSVRALNKLGIDLTIDPKTGKPYLDPKTGEPMKMTVENIKKIVMMEALDRVSKLGLTMEKDGVEVAVTLDDLMHDPAEVASRIRETLEDESTRRGRWASYMLKEAKNAPDGRLSAADLDEINAAFDAGEEPPGYAPRRRPRGKDAGSARVDQGEAPVQPAAAGELQQNPPPGSAAEGQEAPGQQGGEAGRPTAGGRPVGGNELSLSSPFHPRNLKAAAQEIQANDRANVQRYNEALRTARSALKKYGNEVNHIRSERIEDATDVPGIDQVAEYLKGEYPDLFPSNQNSDDALFSMLKDGNKRIMTAEESQRQAEAWAHGQADAAEVAQTNKELDSGAFKRLSAADIEWAERSAREQVAEEAGVDPESLGGPAESDRLGEDTGDTSFDFGANAPGAEPAAASAPSPAPGDGNAPADRGVRGAIDTFVHDEAGSLNLDRLKLLAEEAKEKAKVVWDNGLAGIREMAGQSFPVAHRLAQDVGNALARLASSRTYVSRATPYFIDKVMGPGATPETRKLFGATFGELRVRYAKAAWMAAGDLDAARNATSFIGMKDSPLTSEKQFQQVAASPEFKAMLDRYKSEFVGVMEDYFKKAQGMDPADVIASFTQIPDLPVQFRRVEESGAGAPMGSARGSLKAQQARKLRSAEAAGLDAKQYETDMGSIIENTLASRVELANKADLYRQIEANGLGEWRVPGPHRVEGENGPLVEIANVKPPKGTQEAKPGQTSLYVDPKIESEVRKALNLNPVGPWTQASSIVTKPFTSLGLASTVEVAYHSLNQLTFAATKPGVRIGDIWKNMSERWNNTPEFQKKLMEIARIGAMKPSYHEGAPSMLKWGARLLDGIGDVMRASASDAFDRLVDKGAVNTEQNKRDFINQLGQYERRAQNGAVAWLRDSGIGPFATAGTNYLTQGVRTLWLDPGVKFNTTEGAVRARANVLGRIATGLALTAAANYLAWGRLDGDEKTPIGSVKIGESNGKSITVDLSGPFLWKRGLRAIGLLAMMEGERGGRQEGSSLDHAREDVMHSVLHPAMGPAAQFVKTAFTGKNTFGMQMSDVAKPGHGSQTWNDVKAAAANASPLGPLALQTIGVAPPGREKPTSERLAELLGPYGPRWHAKPVASPVSGRRR